MPFDPKLLTFDQGEVTARAKEDLQPGEMTETVGAEYRLRGDPKRLHRVPGRKLFGTVKADEPVDGIKICRFDDPGNSRVLAMVQTGLYTAPVGETGTFTQIGDTRTGDVNDRLSAAHVNDQWFIVTKSNTRTSTQNDVLLPDGSTRKHGMLPPPGAPGLLRTTEPAQVVDRVTVDDALTLNPLPPLPTIPPTTFKPFIDTQFAATVVPPSDSGSPFSYVALGYEGISTLPVEIIDRGGCEWGFSDTGDGQNRNARYLEVHYFVAGPQNVAQALENYPAVSYFATLTIEISENGGSSYSQWLKRDIGRLPGGTDAYMNEPELRTLPIFVGNDAVPNDQLKVRVTCTLTRGAAATCRIYSIQILGDGQTVTTDPNKTVEYAFTEVDEANGLESEPSPTSRLQITDGNGVRVTFPDPVNENTTLYRLYRTPEFALIDEATAPQRNEILPRLGFVLEVNTTNLDGSDNRQAFDPLDFFNRQTFPVIDLVSIAQGDGTTFYYPANRPPPPMTHISAFRNSLVGVNGRAWFRSLSARPDKWPEVLAIDSLPLEENDTLVACLQVGDSLVIAATGVMLAIDDPPRIINRLFSAPRPRKIAEIGLVGQDAITTVSQGEDKEDLCAWVSYQGIHLTNTYTSRTITDEADWERLLTVGSLESAVLDFDIDTLQLKLSYDSDGDGRNDRYALLHMAPQHSKANGLPKITWGNYANIQSLDSQIVDGALRSYSGDHKGNVYLERVGTRDDSLAYNAAGDVPFRVGLHINGDWYYLKLFRGSLRNDASNPVEMMLTFLANFETIDEVQQTVVAVTANGRPATFLVDRAGESFDITIEAIQQGELSLLDCRMMIGIGDLVHG